MSEQSNLQTVQNAYADFGKGDIASLLGRLSADVVWKLPVVAGAPIGGERHGREGVTEFFRLISEFQEAKLFEPREFVAGGEKVVVLGRYDWKVSATGREFGSDWVHVFSFADGQIVRFQEFTGTAEIAAAYAG
jgi:ketosteroid isomerase-like protein